jgi:hypothetical protein
LFLQYSLVSGVTVAGVERNIMDKRLEEIIRDPKKFLDHRGSDTAFRVVEKAYKSDIELSIDRFIHILVDRLQLSFAGLYINSDFNFSFEFDKPSNRTIRDRTSQLEDYVRDANRQGFLRKKD